MRPKTEGVCRVRGEGKPMSTRGAAIHVNLGEDCGVLEIFIFLFPYYFFLRISKKSIEEKMFI